MATLLANIAARVAADEKTVERHSNADEGITARNEHSLHQTKINKKEGFACWSPIASDGTCITASSGIGMDI